MNMIDIYLQIFELYLLGFILGGCGGGAFCEKLSTNNINFSLLKVQYPLWS